LHKEVAKITENLKSIVECSQISMDKQNEDVFLERNMREGLQLQVNSAQIAASIETLLSLVFELKEAYILNDYNRYSKLVSLKKQELDATSEDGQALIKELKKDVDLALFELETHYLNSKYH